MDHVEDLVALEVDQSGGIAALAGEEVLVGPEDSGLGTVGHLRAPQAVLAPSSALDCSAADAVCPSDLAMRAAAMGVQHPEGERFRCPEPRPGAGERAAPLLARISACEQLGDDPLDTRSPVRKRQIETNSQ